jgi:hypothetical protein
LRRRGRYAKRSRALRSKTKKTPIRRPAMASWTRRWIRGLAHRHVVRIPWPAAQMESLRIVA